MTGGLSKSENGRDEGREYGGWKGKRWGERTWVWWVEEGLVRGTGKEYLLGMQPAGKRRTNWRNIWFAKWEVSRKEPVKAPSTVT